MMRLRPSTILATPGSPTVPPRPRRLRHLAANLVVLLIGIIAAGLVLEGLLRVYNPFLTRIKRDRVVLLDDGQVAAEGPTGEILGNEPLLQAHGLA